MNLPEGDLRKSRVVTDPRVPLAQALDDGLTGYARFEPQDTLLLDAGGRGVLTFRDGVPQLAYYSGGGQGGPAALAALATPGPYHVELYDLSPTALENLGDDPSLRVPPGMPAERLAGDPALAASTRRAAGVDPTSPATTTSADAPAEDAGAVESFLDDEEKIAAIQERARAEAKRRAEEWDLE